MRLISVLGIPALFLLSIFGCSELIGPTYEPLAVPEGSPFGLGRDNRDGRSTLRFSGYEWRVHSGHTRPGPTRFEPRNAWVDENGWLHLLISREFGDWRGAYVTIPQRLGFGTYEWEVTGQLDAMDRNVVFGLFNYPTSDVGPDGTNEIDIEFTRWGKNSNPNGWFVIWPPFRDGKKVHKSFQLGARTLDTTHRFTWTSTGLVFESYEGHRPQLGRQLARWEYRPSDPERTVPQKAMPVHMNLWLQSGRPPSDGREVEIVIKRFSFTPQ